MGSALNLLTAGDQYKRNQASINASRITQKSGNERRAAEAQAGRTAQAIGNRRAMDAAGEQINAIAENTVRNLDAVSSGTLSQRMQAAETLGQISAQASAAGVGGSSVDLYKSTLRLKEAVQEERQSRQVTSSTYAAETTADQIMVNGVDSLDNSNIIAGRDVTQYVDAKKPSTFGTLAAFSAAAAATYFGGPQAGSAVLDAYDGLTKAQSGDFGGAGAKFDVAISRGLSGVKTSRSLAKPGETFGSWYQSIFNKQDNGI